ncbi:MAG TPA: contractile injection system protein, VgrG/Pvc8 family [Candidatus Binataceae bacterium]|nr:contractile injection system protein, VgrG/Pvc8 family [Candidatus Binataceae bacterium]
MATALAYPVRSPNWILTYQGIDITTEVGPMVRTIYYYDRLGSASGELEIEFEDRDKLWQGPWYPALGDEVNVSIGYQGEELQPCGTFQVDELELDGPPDVMKIRCLAAFITPAMRTLNSAGYEGQTILGIAETIANKYSLQLITAPKTPDVAYERVTQKRETDLEFLRRLADEHGYDFTVRGSLMVFYALEALESAAPVITIERSNTLRFGFRNRSRGIYAGAQVAYQDPVGKRLIAATQSSAETTPTANTLKLVTRCENGSQAAVKAAAGLHFHDMRFIETAIDGPGSAALAAGITVAISGWGVLDGTYLVESARHRIDRATGYTTAIAARRVS